MAFRWDDYLLDSTGNLLTRKGRRVAVSRKVLICCKYLIEHRERTVSFDELSHALWGHKDVTHHQLSQVILSARRALDDDGHAQRVILTLPGVGYRWVGEVEVCESCATTAPPQPETIAVAARNDPAPPARPTPETDSDSAPLADREPALGSHPIPAAYTVRTALFRRIGAAGLGLALVVSLGVFALGRPNVESAKSGRKTTIRSAPIAELESALYRGEFESVRAGLAALPSNIENSPDARLLEIELDLNRGRAERAMEKMEVQLARPEAKEPVLRARLLIVKSKISSKLGLPAEERLAHAQNAIDLLEALGPSAPPGVLGLALERRASSRLGDDDVEAALSDFSRAIQLLETAGDERAAHDALSNLARVWMQMGRLHSALTAFEKISKYYRDTSNRVGELYARNTMTRIQMELMRWDDALASSDRSLELLEQVPDAERRYRALQLRAQVLTSTGRLRLAASQLEEATASADHKKGFVIPAFFLLESGDYVAAMREASRAFDGRSAMDRKDILLDGREGALLIWVSAAQASQRDGAAFPKPNAKAMEILQKPTTALGRIARARWLWSQGRLPDAERELRVAIQESLRMNQFYRASLATEPLIEILLQRKDVAGAEAALDSLHALDRPRLDRDFRFNVMRLRIAVAKNDFNLANEAHRRASALAGERSLPKDIQTRYAQESERRARSGGGSLHSGSR